MDHVASSGVIAGQYFPSQADVFEGHRVIYRKNIQARVMNGIVGVIFLFLAGVVMFNSQLALIYKILMAVSVVIVVPAAFSDRFWWLFGFGLFKSNAPVSVRITRHAIQLSSAGFDQALPWRDYVSAAETEDAFVLFRSPRHFLVLPKRAFHAPDLGAFRSLARSIFGDRAELVA